MFLSTSVTAYQSKSRKLSYFKILEKILGGAARCYCVEDEDDDDDDDDEERNLGRIHWYGRVVDNN